MKVYDICFSPTGTSAKVSEAVSRGIARILGDCETVNCNFTLSAPDIALEAEDVAVIAAPVYGGHLAVPARRRLDAVSGAGALCVVIAVYGNRAFENAVADMAVFVRERGFKPVAAAAFVGEHSYSTDMTPIAVGRPDEVDLNMAEEFGRRVGERIISGIPDEVDVTVLADEPSPEQSLCNFRAFVTEYQKMQTEAPRKFLPEVSAEICTGCGTCAEVCPTGAISADGLALDAEKCIKCCACVKACPENARTLFTPFAKPLSENFRIRKQPRFVIAE